MKFRRVSCDQIAEISVKLSLVRPEGIPRSIDGNQNPLEIGTALEDQLMIGDLDIAVRTIAQSLSLIHICSRGGCKEGKREWNRQSIIGKRGYKDCNLERQRTEKTAAESETDRRQTVHENGTIRRSGL